MGMLAATTIAIFLIPAIFYVVEKFSLRFSKADEPKPVSTQPEPAPAGD
jgi:hypothetical protein